MAELLAAMAAFSLHSVRLHTANVPLIADQAVHLSPFRRFLCVKPDSQ